MTNTSLIITVLNEQETITALLNAILAQTLLPNEVVICDGGSSDQTANLITNFAQEHPRLNLKIIIKKGNRSVGRNAAIIAAEHEVIAITDAGCIPHVDWLQKLVDMYEKIQQKDATIAGYYDADPKTPFEEAVIPYVLVMPDHINPQNFLPATRSMLMTKSVWKHVGRFDESLSDNEDYDFAKRLEKAKLPIFFCEEAKVTWVPRQHLRQFFWMIFRFARGDIFAQILRPKVAFLFARYVIFMAILAVFFLVKSYIGVFFFILLSAVFYFGWAVKKNIRYVPHGWYWLPILQVAADMAVIMGSIHGAAELWRKGHKL